MNDDKPMTRAELKAQVNADLQEAEDYLNPEEPSVPWWRAQKTRQYLYRVGASLLVVVGAYFAISADQQTMILDLLGAVLAVGGSGALIIADRNVK